MTALLALLASHWRAAILAGLLAVVGALGLTVRHYREEVLTARTEAAAAREETATVRKDALDNQLALEQSAADAAARAARDDQLMEAINASKPSAACAQSAAMRALLGGLRKPAGAGSASRGSHHAAVVPR